MAYDDILVRLGEFGRYQKRIYILLCLPAISCALHKLSGVFLQARVAHRCRMPQEAEDASYSDVNDTISSLVYPWDSLQKSRSTCLMYNTNYTDSYFSNGIAANATVNCVAGWVYDTTKYHSTTLTEWDLVCDKAWLRATSDAFLMVGVMIGAIVFGDLSDRIGRKPIFFLSLVLQVIFGALIAVSPNYYCFIISRMIVGATSSGVYLVAYVIAMEMVGPRKRMIAGVIFQMFFTLGFLLTAGFSYFFRDWRILQIALTIPGIAFFSYWWFIPESVRWLLTKEKWEQAKQSLRDVAKENKKSLPESVLQDLCIEMESDKRKESASHQKPSLLVLFKSPNIRKKSFIIFYIWFVSAATYYGLSWNTSDLGGNEYVNFIISGLVEIPGYSVLLFTLDRYGRRAVLCAALMFAGVCLLTSSFIPQSLVMVKVCFAMLGKLAITSAYGAVYVVTAEQFPTVIRNVALGASSTAARIGGILAPYVNIMAEIWTPLPFIIFGVMALSSGLLTLLLPETLNKTLPETIEDGENFGKKGYKKSDINKNGEELKELNRTKS